LEEGYVLQAVHLRQHKIGASTPDEGYSGTLTGRPNSSFVELKISQVMRDVLVAPESKTVPDLIHDFQQRRRQPARFPPIAALIVVLQPGAPGFAIETWE
jgi:hypothetical protein